MLPHVGDGAGPKLDVMFLGAVELVGEGGEEAVSWACQRVDQMREGEDLPAPSVGMAFSPSFVSSGNSMGFRSICRVVRGMVGWWVFCRVVRAMVVDWRYK